MKEYDTSRAEVQISCKNYDIQLLVIQNSRAVKSPFQWKSREKNDKIYYKIRK